MPGEIPDKIFIRERDRQEARIKNLETRFKDLMSENDSLKKRLAILEDRFRDPPVEQKPVRVNKKKATT